MTLKCFASVVIGGRFEKANFQEKNVGTHWRFFDGYYLSLNVGIHWCFFGGYVSSLANSIK